VKYNRRGYVLVMTLGLLMLAATLLVTLGRASTARVLASKTEQRELQRRWAVVSCRNAVLPFSVDILAKQEALQNRPIPGFRVSIVLGDQRYTLLVSDEQAKANVNLLLEHSDKSRAEARLREALSGSGLGNSIFLRPEPRVHAEVPPSAPGQPPSRPELPSWLSGFGQVFTNVGPERLVAGGVTAPVSQLTCWGSGAVNIMRVSESALRLAATPALTNIECGRLIDARNKAFAPRNTRASPNLPTAAAAPARNLDAVGNLLAQARVDPKARLNLPLTSTSTCYSLWIIRQDRERSEYWLFVSDESRPQSPRIEAFSW
jgi:hypothetical protein